MSVQVKDTQNRVRTMKCCVVCGRGMIGAGRQAGRQWPRSGRIGELGQKFKTNIPCPIHLLETLYEGLTNAPYNPNFPKSLTQKHQRYTHMTDQMQLLKASGTTPISKIDQYSQRCRGGDGTEKQTKISGLPLKLRILPLRTSHLGQVVP